MSRGPRTTSTGIPFPDWNLMNLLHTGLAATALVATSLAQIQPNDGIVGGMNSGNYALYRIPGLGTATPGAPTAITYSATLAPRLNHFVIDRANANLIATATSATGGDVEVWRLDVQGNNAVEAQLTTLPGTAGLNVAGMHRDASGCILVLCNAGLFSPTFTVHRLAVTRSGALAVQVPIANPANDALMAIATTPAGQIVLGGKRAPYNAAAPGVTHFVSMAGGTLSAGTPITGFHVISAETNSIGVPAFGLSPQTLPPTANFMCGGTSYNFQYNTPPFTSLWLDIELNPAQTQFVLAGNGGGALGVGVLIRIGAVGCVAGTPSTPIYFPHGLNQVAIAFPSKKYGCGCPPSNGVLPKIDEVTPPTLGLPWQITLTDGVPLSTAMLVSGRTDTGYLGNPLPIPLSQTAFNGQASCFLLNSAQFVYPVQSTDASGRVTHTRVIPNSAALLGTKVFSEWLVYETTGGVPPFSTAGLASVVQ